LRQSAQELSAKAAAQVNEINSKVMAKQDGDPSTTTATSSGTPRSGNGAPNSAEKAPAAAAAAAASAAPPTMSQLKSDNASKEDLMDILQKMNKKVKALSTLRLQLTERAETAESEKARFAALLQDEILNGAVTVQEGQDEVLQYQAAWRAQDEEKSMALQQLQTEFQVSRMQQVSSGNGGGGADAGSSSNWEAEKNLLIQTHAQATENLKGALTKKHAQELEQLKANMEQSASSTGSTEDEVKRIKAAASAQLLSFKKKVAVARTAELVKVRGEADVAAKAAIESKLAEQSKQHEAQVVALREELEAKAKSELEQERKQLLESGSQEKTLVEEMEKKHAAEIQRLKEEASEIEKSRQAVEQTATSEADETAKAAIESKLAEQSKQHEAQLVALREELEAKAKSELEQERKQLLESGSQEKTVMKDTEKKHAAEIQRLKEEADVSRASEIEKTRQEVEQTITTDMEEKLQELLGDLRQKHKEEIERLSTESSKQLNDAQKNASGLMETSKANEEMVSAAKSEVDQLKIAHAAETKSLKDEIESTVTRLEKEKQVLESSAASLQEMAVKKDTEMASSREETTSAQEAERERLVAEFEQEKARLRLEMEEKIDETSRQSEASTASQEEAIKQAKQEYQASLDQERQRLEEGKRVELEKLREESSLVLNQAVKDTELRGSSQLENVQKSLQSQIQALETQSRASADDLQSAQQSGRTLQGELEDIKVRLAAAEDERSAALAEAQDGESATQMIDEARSKQKASYEAILENQKSRFEQEVESMKKQIEEASRAREEALSGVSALRLELETLQTSALGNEKAATEAIAVTKEEVADRDAQLAKKENQYLSEKTTLEQGLEKVKVELDVSATERQRLLDELSETKTASEVSLVSRTKEIAELQERLKSESLQLNEGLQNNAQELERMEEEFKKERESYTEKVNMLQRDYEESQKAITGIKDGHEKALKELRENVQSESSADMDERIAAARQELLAQKETETELLKSTYEEKLEDCSKKEALMGQTFNKVKAAYGAKMKKVEEELSAKIVELEKKNGSLEELANDTRTKTAEESERSELEVVELRRSLEKREEQVGSEKAELEERLRNSEEKAASLGQEYDSKILQLEKDLEDARQQVMEAKDAVPDGTQQEELTAQLSAVEEEHATALQNARAKHESALKRVQEESEAVRANLESEMSSRLEQEEAKLADKLEAQARQYAEEKQEQRKAMEAHVDQMGVNFKGKLKSVQDNYSAEFVRLQEGLKEKDAKLSKLLERLKAITASTTSLRNENEGLKAKLKAEGSVQRELRSQLNSMKSEMEETVANSSATATALLGQQENLEIERGKMEKELEKLKRLYGARGNQLEEVKGKLSALTANLNAMAEERKEQDEKLRIAEKAAAKLKASEVEVSDLREQINKLKLDMTKSTSLVNRLQAEKETGERSHGQRTALVGMLETQLSEMNDKNADTNAKLEAALYDLSQKDEAIQSSEEQVRKLEEELVKAKNATLRANESVVSAQKGTDARTAKMVESLQKELQSVKQQMGRKSAAAQRLLQDRESECGELRNTNKALQSEVDKGSLSDRRIFELAAKQSNRESHQLSEIEMRDSIIERMTEALLDRDGDLATAENQVQAVEGQVEELCRVRRREDVNLDYLKSIVVQYLSLPPGSSERARLLPVLATLLQFDDSDYKIIEEGKNKISWWGSIAPTNIGPPASITVSPQLPPTTSIAEVSVSTGAESSTNRESGGKPRTTSLQF
jgi:hypothetical protein